MFYQNLGLRLLAQVIDGIILGVFYFLLSKLITWLSAASDPVALIFAFGVTSLLFFIAEGLYFIIMEAYLGGTVGKLVLGLRVVREDGSSCGLIPSLIRNLLRIIDWLPAFYLIGIISMWISPLSQRLGDRLAHTKVIRAGIAPEVPPQSPQQEEPVPAPQPVQDPLAEPQQDGQPESPPKQDLLHEPQLQQDELPESPQEQASWPAPEPIPDDQPESWPSQGELADPVSGQDELTESKPAQEEAGAASEKRE